MRHLTMLLTLLLASAGAAAGQESDIEALKRRVSDLEAQNRAMAGALDELRARLDKSSPAPAAPQPAAAAAQPAPSPRMDVPAQWREIASAESRLRFYGFLRLDALSDSVRPDNPQNPFFVVSEDPRAGGKPPAHFTLFPRLTRFGVNYQGPSLAGARLSGQLELDFNNGGSESRPIPRIRHANLRLTRGGFQLLAGQTFDLISPLFPVVNHTTLMWNTGNLGDRRPQLQAVFERAAGAGRLSLGVALGLSGAIDALDLDADGYRDGEESGRPNLQARLGYTRNTASGQAAGFGIWGHRGWERTARPYLGKRDFRAHSVGIDFTAPLAAAIALRGEAWAGRNLSDFRGGVGQGINPLTGAGIRSRGGWIEAAFRTGKVWTVAPGYTVDDPRDPDIAPNGRTRNRAWYLGNRFTLGGGLSLGADYLRWTTDYKGMKRGADNRFNLFVQYAY